MVLRVGEKEVIFKQQAAMKNMKDELKNIFESELPWETSQEEAWKEYEEKASPKKKW